MNIIKTLDELERAVYVSPTVENMRAYIDALEAYIEDLRDEQKELENLLGIYYNL